MLFFLVLVVSGQAQDLTDSQEILLPPESFSAARKCGEEDLKGNWKCVPYFNCDPLTNSFVAYPEVDGSNLIEPRDMGSDPRCDHFLEVCCQVKSEFYTEQLYFAVETKFEPRCGFTDSWTVALLHEFEPFCGGSLLTPVVVLTAAHCVQNFSAEDIKVRGGSSTQELDVSEIVMHDHYIAPTLYNDVALLFLNQSFIEADNVGTVCLPKNVEDVNKTSCFVSEWREKLTDLSVVPKSSCEKDLRKKIGHEFVLDHSFVCALGNICKVFGGSPLMCSDSSNRYFQVGIVSWSVGGCDNDNIPGVYSNVILFRDWIYVKLVERGYNTNPYTPH